MEQGWDPQVRKYFRKILYSISWGLIWMIGCATAGLYFELGSGNGGPIIYTVLFYIAMAVSLALLVRYLYKTWKDG